MSAGCASLSAASQLLAGTRKNCQLKLAKILVLLGIVSIVAACSSSADEPTATIEPTATTAIAVTSVVQDSTFYLNSIQNSAVQVTAAFARVGQDLSRVWPTRGALIDAIGSSGVSEEMSTNIQAIIQLTPPDEFEQEHQVLANGAFGKSRCAVFGPAEPNTPLSASQSRGSKLAATRISTSLANSAPQISAAY